ncbi:MAG: hypothetical protein JNG42_09485 [Holdemanella sp.]|nr:hypothetical protein [Holdemanella sp.]
MTDEDFDFLEKVYNKLRSAKVTGSSVRLNSAEIKIILKNQEDIMDMLSDKDYELLDEVFQKLKQADNTCSDVVLDPEEVRVLVDEFDDFNHELVEIKKIIDEFEKEIGMKE